MSLPTISRPGRPGDRGEASRPLPAGIRAADLLTLALLALTIAIAVHPTRFTVLGLQIRMRSWPRPLVFALMVAAVRHGLVSRPSLGARLAGGVHRGLGHGMSAARSLVPTRKQLPLAAALVLPSLLNVAILLHGYDGVTYLRGDCPYYYWTARSILAGDGLKFGRELPGGWRGHVNQIALAVDGQPVPKHPVVLPIISLPFIGAFGEPGALVFNVAQVTALLWILFRLARLAARPAAASAAVIATYAASFLPHYLWNYSPDVCAAALLMASVLALCAAPGARALVLGGLLFGAACVAKFPLVVFAPGSLLLLRKPFGRQALLFGAGVALPFAAFAAMNAHLFGSPLVTSYDRIARLTASGAPAVYTQRSSFDLPIREGIRGQILDREHGLLATSPVTLAALAGIPLFFRRRPRLAAHLVLGSLALFLLFSTYDQWSASHYGNRFLMPLVVAFTVPLAVAFDAAAAWSAGWRPARRGPEAA